MFGLGYPNGGIWPDWVWQMIADIGVIAAIAAFIAALIYLWNHGPRLLIAHGPKIFTRWGELWQSRRDNGNGTHET